MSASPLPPTLPSHHAVLVRASWEEVEEALRTLLKVGSWSSDPDVVLHAYDDMGVEDARALRARASEQPLSRTVVTYVISAKRMTREAQNALLKLFEDPPRVARFVVVLPTHTFVAPTLLSRFFVITARRTLAHDTERLPALGELSALGDTLKKDPDLTERILGLLHFSHSSNVSTLRAVHTLQKFYQSKGASSKMLIEHALLTQYEHKLD
jgi:hypothetical protein